MRLLRSRVALDCLVVLTWVAVDERGFVPTTNENAVIFSTVLCDSVANATPIAPSPNDSDMCGGLPVNPSPRSFLPAIDSSNNFHRQTGQLRVTGSGEQQHTQCATSDSTVAHKRQGQNVQIVWGMPRVHVGEHHKGQQRTLKRMPSDVEFPGQVIEGLAMTPHRFSSPITRVQSSVPAYPPPGVNTDCESTSKLSCRRHQLIHYIQPKYVQLGTRGRPGPDQSHHRRGGVAQWFRSH